MPQAKTVRNREYYNHRILWRVARTLHTQANVKGYEDFFFKLPALLMARLTVEAYANFLLEVLYPDTFACEKETFGSETHKKLKWIGRKIGAATDRGTPPYREVNALNDFRNLVAHAKPEHYVAAVLLHALEEQPPGAVPGEIEAATQAIDLSLTFRNVADFCEDFHKRALAVSDAQQRARLQTFALEGTTYFGIHSSTVAE